MSRPSPSSISPTTAVTFDVPTSSPTRYRSFRATLSSGSPSALPRVAALDRRLPASPRDARPRPLAGLAGRPHVDAIVEPQVHVVDVGDALAQRRRELEVRLQPRQELVLAE